MNSTEKSLVLKKHLKFTCEDTNSDLDITLIETIEGEYSSYLWPCSVVLAQYIWINKNVFKNKRILEIGAGTALPSLVAAKCTQFSSITITDKHQSDKYLMNLQKSLEVNGLSSSADINITSLSWQHISLDLTRSLCNSDGSLPDITLAADCFYDQNLFEEILGFVYFILKSKKEEDKNSEPMFLCTYQVRCRSWTIEGSLDDWSLQAKSIPLNSFGADDVNIAKSGMPANHLIELFKITLKN